MAGWIKLHRDILESKCFAHPTTLKIWIWLLMKAKHKKVIILLKVGKGEIEVELKRGQLIFGRFKAEDELNIDGSTIYKHIQKLQEWENILIESNNQYSIVTICKYDDYQTSLGEEEQVSNNQVATNEQPSSNQVTQIKNVNKDKKEEELKESFEVFWNLYEKKIGKKDKLLKKWISFSDEDRLKIFQHVPKYKVSQPDKKYRKNVESYFNNLSWNDEIIDSVKSIEDLKPSSDIFNPNRMHR